MCNKPSVHPTYVNPSFVCIIRLLPPYSRPGGSFHHRCLMWGGPEASQKPAPRARLNMGTGLAPPDLVTLQPRLCPSAAASPPPSCLHRRCHVHVGEDHISPWAGGCLPKGQGRPLQLTSPLPVLFWLPNSYYLLSI